MGKNKPLKVTDRRRSGMGDNVKVTVSVNDGAAPPLMRVPKVKTSKNGRKKGK